MALLDATQEKLIHELWEEKCIYDEAKEELRVARLAEDDELKAGLRLMVNECEEAGIPARAIHQRGLGLKQVSQMRGLLAHRTGKSQREETLELLEDVHTNRGSN